MDFKQIRDGLEKILQEMESSGSYTEESLVKLFDELAYMYHSNGFLEMAQKYYFRSLTSQEKITGTNSLECVETLHRLGVVCRVQEKFEMAEYFYSRAYTLTQVHSEESSLDIATRSNYISGLYLAWGQYQKAKEALDLSIKLYREKLGENHLYVGFCLIALAIIEHKQGEKEKANICLDIADGIVQPLVLLEISPSKASLPALVASLALIYLRQQKIEEAEVMFRFALIQEASDLWPAHPSVGSELKKLSTLYRAKGRNKAARFLDLEAHNLSNGISNPEDPAFTKKVALMVDKSEDFVIGSYNKGKLIASLKAAAEKLPS